LPVMDSVDVILPCLNEAAALPGVLARLPRAYRAIVVDNGSTDGSAQVAREHGATVVEETRRGYGAAVHAGLEAAETSVVGFLDCDGSLDAGQLPLLVDRVRSRAADLAVGRRVPVRRGLIPWHAKAGNDFLTLLLRRRGLRVRDIGPMRAVRRIDLLALGVADRGFGYPLELLVRAQRAGWRVLEQPVDYLPRAAGTRSKVSGSVRGTCRAVWDMAGVLK
jgi:glycosyltransferase involved in cell wall biosynthesis